MNDAVRLALVVVPGAVVTLASMWWWRRRGASGLEKRGLPPPEPIVYDDATGTLVKDSIGGQSFDFIIHSPGGPSA